MLIHQLFQSYLRKVLSILQSETLFVQLIVSVKFQFTYLITDTGGTQSGGERIYAREEPNKAKASLPNRP